MRLKLSLLTSLLILVVACTSDDQVPTDQNLDAARPWFTVSEFESINPHPDIRELDLESDHGFDEREKLPRDAIEPIYSPKFVSTSEVDLNDDEMVMGLSINGDTRAYPVGLMRFREMVNDNVGGYPVLVSW